MTALNPVYTIGFQIVETLRTHFDIGPKEARARALELLRLVEIPDPDPPYRRVPAPAVRRSAPARDDRAGPGVRPEAAHRRRADHGSRRHRAGRDPQAHARPAHAHRLRHRAHHARHGRRRRPGRQDHRDEGRSGRRGGCRRSTSSPRRPTRTRSSCSTRCRTSGRSADVLAAEDAQTSSTTADARRCAARRRRRAGRGARGQGHGHRVPRPSSAAGVPCGRRREPDAPPRRGRRAWSGSRAPARRRSAARSSGSCR